MDLVAQYYAQFAVEMEQVKKAVDTLDAKQNATKELVEGLQSLVQSQMQELRADNQALRARLDGLYLSAKEARALVVDAYTLYCLARRGLRPAHPGTA